MATTTFRPPPSLDHGAHFELMEVSDFHICVRVNVRYSSREEKQLWLDPILMERVFVWISSILQRFFFSICETSPSALFRKLGNSVLISFFKLNYAWEHTDGDLGWWHLHFNTWNDPRFSQRTVQWQLNEIVKWSHIWRIKINLRKRTLWSLQINGEWLYLSTSFTTRRPYTCPDTNNLELLGNLTVSSWWEVHLSHCWMDSPSALFR